MIDLTGASRWYGQVIGLNDVSCQIGPGVTALLGPNGAGKSTMLKLITGQLRPTTGSVTVLGESPFANTGVLRRLGYCPEIEQMYEDLTGRQMVTLLGSLSGISGDELKPRVQAVIEQVGMADRCDRKIGGYSKGMRQRIKLAQGLIHEPDVLILDEPLNGLDPMGRRDVTNILHQYAERGKCVVVSSHILYEVEQMTRNILLLYRGRLMAQGDIYQIRSMIDKHPHRITIETDRPRPMALRLLSMESVASVRLDDGARALVEIETRSPETFYAEFPKVVLEDGFNVQSFESPDNNLESVFKYLVER
jgi:ABC-2 type transport system ATP-binding protein